MKIIFRKKERKNFLSDHFYPKFLKLLSIHGILNKNFILKRNVEYTLQFSIYILEFLNIVHSINCYIQNEINNQFLNKVN